MAWRAGTVEPLRSRSWDERDFGVEPRLGVLMNPYTPATGPVRQLFVSEPFNNSIAVVNLVVVGTAPNQVFGLGSVNRIRTPWLRFPVDLAAVQRDAENLNWASNTTLDNGSDIYVANRGNNTIVRMSQVGNVVAVRHVPLDGGPLGDARVNGVTTSTDGTAIYVTFTGPSHRQGGVVALPAF